MHKPDIELLHKFSSLSRLIRIVAQCYRWLLIVKQRTKGQSQLPPFVTITELRKVRQIVIKLAQSVSYKNEIEILNKGKNLPKKYPLIKLNIFLEPGTGILRVGGRLHHANVPYERKHPAILHRESFVAQFWVLHTHHLCLHGGPTLTNVIGHLDCRLFPISQKNSWKLCSVPKKKTSISSSVNGEFTC